SKVRSEQYDGVIWCPEVEDYHNLLVERNGKFVFCGNSSAHVYGISPKYMPTDEKHPLALQDTYTTSKRLGDSLCQLFNIHHNLEYVTTRLYNAYGPGQNEDYFIPAMISKAKARQNQPSGKHVPKDSA